MAWQKYFRLTYCLLLLLAAGGSSVFVRQSHAQYLNPEKAISQYVHSTWDAEDGLPQGSINAIAQTPDGYVWFGTQEGLVRFDGIEQEIFNTRNVEAFQSNDIRVLQLDSNGALWIGTRNAGLIKYRAGTFDVLANQDSLKDRRITAIVESKRGHFWIGTAESGLKKLDKGDILEVPEIPVEHITALYESDDGVLWIGTRSAGLYRYTAGEVQVIGREEGLPESDITSLAGSKHGGLWVGTRESGLVHYHGGLIYQVNTTHGLNSDRILSLYEDPIGSLWIGTNQNGMARLQLDTQAMEGVQHEREVKTKQELLSSMHTDFYEHMTLSLFSTEEGLSYDVVKVFFQDMEGSLWIGTDGGGVNMLREGKFTTYTTAEGIADDFIYAVHEDLNGAMWFSTEKGVSRLKDGAFTSFTEADGLGSDFVVSVESTPDSSVWLGTYGGGLSRYRNGRFFSYTEADGLPGNAVFGLYQASDGNLWIGTGGGAAMYDGRRFIPYTEAEGLSSNYVTVFMESQDKSIWIGTYNAGINRLHNGSIQTITTADGLSNNAVLSLHEDDQGVIWVGTYGGGLNRIEGDKVTVYTTKEGLFNDNVSQILEDDSNNLWISCNQGLFRVSKQELNAYARGLLEGITSIVYDQADGLKSKEFNGGVQPAGWKSRDGSLWFPSSKGVAMIDPGNILLNPFPPQLVLEKVVIDDHEAPLEGVIEFPPGENKIEFHYAGLSFISPNKVRYKYKLEGEDETWVDAGDRRAAFYTNLEPGYYTFRVIAINNDNLESREAVAYSFYMKPFFYQTIWFYVVSVLGTILLIVLIYRWRVAQLKAHEQMLSRLVEDRTHNLEERTADLLRALEQNKEILGITSHDLKNPLGGIIGLADILIEDFSDLGDDPLINEGLENVYLLKTEAERMLRIVMDLLDRHRSGEQAHSALETVNLGDLVADSIRRNQASADQKEISLHFEKDTVLLVEVEEDSLLRVSDNLISNAVKYSPPGSNVWITLEQEENWACLKVRDEGPGLTDADKEKVFGKMQRLSAQPTGGEHSTGLGLYIVKQLIEDAQGETGVDSEYGQGACFWVRLPLISAFMAV